MEACELISNDNKKSYCSSRVIILKENLSWEIDFENVIMSVNTKIEFF